MKIKKYIKLGLLFLVVGAFNSCLDYEELRENPNQPTSVPPSLIFTNLTPGVTTSFSDAYIRMQYHIWVSTDSEYNINFRSGFGGSFGGYSNLRNIDKMNEAADANDAPVYKILGKFYAARAYIEMTRRMGDIPFSESLQGVNIPRPRYDTQKEVYIGALDMLDEASLELGDFIAANQGYNLAGDAYYGGQLAQWQKLINAYTLRILVSLSKKAGDAQLDVSGRFARIINNPSQYPLMESIADNAELTYRNEDNFRQTYNPDVAVYRQSVHYATTYIDMLKSYNDPRLFAVADPTVTIVTNNPGNPAIFTDPDSYAGADPTVAPSENITLALEGNTSLPNEERYWNFVGQPGVWISYWEQEFCIAEAAHRGWISANAKDHYDNAITGSMKWYGIEDDAAIASYLSAPASQYITGDDGLTRLLEQKYLAFAENSGDESFMNFRRTNVPDLPFSAFNVGAEPGYPMRWSYPGSENSDNPDNYLAALNRQFGVESDDVDFIIWELED